MKKLVKESLLEFKYANQEENAWADEEIDKHFNISEEPEIEENIPLFC